MGHLIKNAFRWKLRNFVCIFWPLVFPLILGTFFHVALDNIGEAETMQAVPVAVVAREESWQTPIVEKYLDAVAQGENPVIKPEKMTWEQAKQALSKEELKKMIKTGGVVEVTGVYLENAQLEQIRALPAVFEASLDRNDLTVKCTDDKEGLLQVLTYLQDSGVAYDGILSQQPTLNDVFLEITGKELRD